MSKFIVLFNTAAAKTKATRRGWERQLIDDFIRAVHRKQYECDSYEVLIARLKLIDGSELMPEGPENFIEVEKKQYGKQRLPIKMYGIAQGYIPFDKVLKPLVERTESSVFIPFRNFYDMRQIRNGLFKRCFVEVHRVA